MADPHQSKSLEKLLISKFTFPPVAVAPMFALLRNRKSGAPHPANFPLESSDSCPPSNRIIGSRSLFIPILLLANLGAMQALAQMWEHSKLDDPREGKTYYQFVLRGKYVVPPSHPNSAPPQLVVFCQPGRFARGQFLPGVVAQPWATKVLSEAHQSHVKIQVDDGKTDQALWDYVNDGMALGFDQLQLKKLLGHPPQDPITKRLTLGISEALGKEVVVQFDLPENPTILVQTCRLK